METDNYTGADATGTSLGRLQLHQWRLGAGRLQSVEPHRCTFSDYSGANETGTLEYQGDNWTSGGSQIEYLRIPNANVTLKFDNYTGAGGTGTLTSADVNFTNGGSEQDINP